MEGNHLKEKVFLQKWWWFLVFAALPILTWALLLFAAHLPLPEASARNRAAAAAADLQPVAINTAINGLPMVNNYPPAIANDGKLNGTGRDLAALDAANADLPLVGSFANLQKLLEEASSRSGAFLYGDLQLRNSSKAPDSIAGTASQDLVSFKEDSQKTPAPSADASSYSSTNLQVEGVDEADIVKTDGQYLYQVNKGRVIIAKIYPPGEMKVCSILQCGDAAFTPREIYVDHNRLAVIGTALKEIPASRPPDPREPFLPSPLPSQKSIAVYPPPPFQQSTLKTIIYDIGDKENVRQLREIELDGRYVSSRKIGAALYLVANQGLGDYRIMPAPAEAEAEAENFAPSYRDTIIQDDFIKIGYEQIRYFPGFLTPNYLLVAGLNLEQNTTPVEIQAFLGAGETIYASLEHLYITVSSYGCGNPEIRRLPVAPAGPDTMLYKFALDRSKIRYTAQGKVPGTILNQFSLDEYKGHLRVATTTGSSWGGSERISQNNVYILDPALRITGRVEDLAPGEKIYAARFLGKRGYLVTFRTIDPLFVLDLQDPQKPGLLGALKIPGYSDYLHPYDENHLLGFGKETMEIPQKDRQGRVIDSAAIELGMKLSLFDVRDVQNPVEKFKTTIGGPGTHSELLQNHKALLWNKGKSLLAFPLTVMETKNTTPEGFPGYGEFTFQGAYIYNLDLQKGFQLWGKITHLNPEDYLKAGQHWFDSDKNVERIIFIHDTLYTLSPGRIEAHALPGLQGIGSLQIPAP